MILKNLIIILKIIKKYKYIYTFILPALKRGGIKERKRGRENRKREIKRKRERDKEKYWGGESIFFISNKFPI